jgi:hypothetical protein
MRGVVGVVWEWWTELWERGWRFHLSRWLFVRNVDGYAILCARYRLHILMTPAVIYHEVGWDDLGG